MKQIDRTKREAKWAAEAEKKRQWRALCKYVDTRDDYRSRISGRRVRKTLSAVPERLERHHLVKRSQGGEDTKENVIVITLQEHIDIHTHGILKVWGNGEGEVISQYQGKPEVRSWPVGRQKTT